MTRRPNPGWSLARVHGLLYRNTLDLEALAEFAALPGLSPSWQTLALRRLERRAVESWNPRVETPD